MRRLMNALAVALMLGAAATALLLGPSLLAQESDDQRRASGGGQALPVLVEPVALRARQIELEAVGTALARQSVVLHPAAAGEVTAVNFQAGQRVEAGAVLLELDQRAEQLQLELARVRLQQARRELARNERMAQSGAVATASLDEARTAARLAGLEVEQAEEALADRRLTAPFSGHIGITDVDVGDRVNVDTPIASLDDRAVLRVEFQVPEAFLRRLSVGDPVAVETWVAGLQRTRGEVSHLGTRVDPQSRSFTVQARVDNAEDRLRPGMSFRVGLTLQGHRYPVVPEVSLLWGDDGAYVWTVPDGRARRVPVTVVERAEGHIFVDGALTAGDPVITEGVHAAREGVGVHVLEDRGR